MKICQDAYIIDPYKLFSQDTRAYPTSPTASFANPLMLALLSLAIPLLLVVEALTSGRNVAIARPPSLVMLASKTVFSSVTVAGAFVIVAVTAVPLELIVMKVWLALSVCRAISVISEPVPTVVERPGVSVRVAEPRVIAFSPAMSSCEEAVLGPPSITRPGEVTPPCAGTSSPVVAVPVGNADWGS